MKNTYLLLSQNSWNSSQKYQRHHLAEYLCSLNDTEDVYFLYKSAIRNYSLPEIIKLTIEIAKSYLGSKLKKNPSERNRPHKLKTLSYFHLAYQSPGAIPALTRHFLYKRIKPILKSESTNLILISYQPIPELLNIKNNFPEITLIYITVHDYQTMPDVKPIVSEVEKKIISASDHSFSDSRSIAKKSLGNSNLALLSPGCPKTIIDASYRNPYSSESIIEIAYFGTIASYLDFHALRELARIGIKITLFGQLHDVTQSAVEKDFNIRIEPPQEFIELSKKLRKFDGIILPYKTNARNQAIIPAKIFECLAIAIPVFSPAMEWNKEKPISETIYRYSNTEELIQSVKDFDPSYFKNNIRPRMLEIAKDNTWTKRFDHFITKIK